LADPTFQSDPEVDPEADPQADPEASIRQRRRKARRTALLLLGVALAVYFGYIYYRYCCGS